MNLKLNDKLRRKLLWLFFIAIIVGGGIALLWLNNHREKAKLDVFARISPEADVGVINLLEVARLMRTDKNLFFPDSIRKASLARFITSPLKMGVDVTVNPVWFSSSMDSSFQIASKINNLSKFKTWIGQGPATEMTLLVDDKNGYQLYSFQEKDYSIALNSEWALFISNKSRATAIANSFYVVEDKDNCAMPLTTSDGALFSLRFASTYKTKIGGIVPVSVAGTLDFQLNDSFCSFKSREFDKSAATVNHLRTVISENSAAINGLEILRDIWMINSKDQINLAGDWQVVWSGVNVKNLEYTSFDFDVNFNRVELKRTKKEYFPNLHITYNPIDSIAGKKWMNHLVSHDIIKGDSAQIGSFWYSFVQSGENFMIGEENNNIRNVKFSTSFYQHIPSLKHDFEQIGIPMIQGHPLMLNNMKSVSMYNEMNQLHITMEMSDENPYHILALISHLFGRVNLQ
jgi:hypothetical protein